MLNFTVSVGTINGLIFFANVVQANHTLFFPVDKMSHSTTFLTVLAKGFAIFIAWLNLDLGIEVCLHETIDAYVLAWLQFVFPIYVWIIVGGMVFITDRSSLAVKLLGRNAVSVLATLLLLSYAKLLRTIIKIFSFTVLKSSSGDTLFVWLIDGNITFLQGKHIPLFVVALAFSLAFIIPYTLLLILIPYLQSHSGYYCLRWVHYIWPLLDAYQGPYKKTYRYWTGLMLVVRIFLFFVFAVNIEGDPQINLLVIVTTVILLLTAFGFTGTVYKISLANYLESFFVFLLGILSSWSLLAKQGSSSHTQAVVSCVIVGFAFVAFVMIITYHVWLKIKKKYHLKSIKSLFKSDANLNAQAEDHRIIPQRSPPPPTVTVVNLKDLREPLLAST